MLSFGIHFSELQINFVDSRISIEEGNGLDGPIKMQYRKTQNPFNLMLHAVTIDDAVAMFDVRNFLKLELEDCSRKAQRKNVLHNSVPLVWSENCKTVRCGFFSGPKKCVDF